jgi:hypothetical protein
MKTKTRLERVINSLNLIAEDCEYAYEVADIQRIIACIHKTKWFIQKEE